MNFLIVLVIILTTVLPALGDEPTAPKPGQKVNPIPYKMDGKGTITGQVMLSGTTPLANGSILLFDITQGPLPSDDKYWRVPEYVDSLNEEGKFSVEVDAGSYAVLATKRGRDTDIGPPRQGDVIFFLADSKGEPRQITIPKDAKVDVGVISRTVRFSQDKVKYGKGITSIAGVVVDPEGKPIQGAIVIAFTGPVEQERPLFVSETTEKDGKFVLRTQDGGTYHLKVRGVYGGGRPSSGEPVVDFEEGEAVSVSVKKSEKLQGVLLKVRKIPKRGSRSANP